MVTKAKPEVLKIQVDPSGNVMCCRAGEMPTATASSVTNFVNRVVIPEDTIVRIIAMKINIPLILQMHERKLSGNIKSLQVCSPFTVGQTGGFNRRPDIAMMDSDNWIGWPASLGGWHEFDDQDYPSYYLNSIFYSPIAGDEKDLHSSIDENFIKGLVNNHPAWDAVSFIPHVSIEFFARLVAVILDPRWYVKPEEPDKTARLESFLGLFPGNTKNSKNLLKTAPEEIRQELTNRQELVKNTWRRGRPISKEEYNQPSNFLWKTHALEGADEMADLRTSQVFVTFLRNVWLDAIYKRRGGASKDGLFVPEYFFKKPDEVEAFKKHMELRAAERNQQKAK